MRKLFKHTCRANQTLVDFVEVSIISNVGNDLQTDEDFEHNRKIRQALHTMVEAAYAEEYGGTYASSRISCAPIKYLPKRKPRSVPPVKDTARQEVKPLLFSERYGTTGKAPFMELLKTLKDSNMCSHSGDALIDEYLDKLNKEES